ncbi:hypothetical protein [Mycobacterium sp. 1423905.2]|uniref:hypothetical protein n=1 Tax=Mycobacterium sp. 1423905.2 TaxID=1856859 RepID=UPI0007FDCB09|nr:hypothetical protein [Mycobacterium sp. 1423905.2]OBJ60346.1 hypothetical protein A9W95_10590 [Mycobacterium sp. 1423905.2]
MRKAWCLFVVLLFGAFFPASAQADPDPHIPDPISTYCPGGKDQPFFGNATCDGIKYPDGSFWRVTLWQAGQSPFYMPTDITLNRQCVIDNGSPDPVPAPPGGCDGAVQ